MPIACAIAPGAGTPLLVAHAGSHHDHAAVPVQQDVGDGTPQAGGSNALQPWQAEQDQSGTHVACLLDDGGSGLTRLDNLGAGLHAQLFRCFRRDIQDAPRGFYVDFGIQGETARHFNDVHQGEGSLLPAHQRAGQADDLIIDHIAVDRNQYVAWPRFRRYGVRRRLTERAQYVHVVLGLRHRKTPTLGSHCVGSHVLYPVLANR